MHPRKDYSADRRASEHSRLFAAEFAFHSTCSLAFAKIRPSHVIRRITTLLHGHTPPAPKTARVGEVPNREEVTVQWVEGEFVCVCWRDIEGVARVENLVRCQSSGVRWCKL